MFHKKKRGIKESFADLVSIYAEINKNIPDESKKELLNKNISSIKKNFLDFKNQIDKHNTDEEINKLNESSNLIEYKKLCSLIKFLGMIEKFLKIEDHFLLRNITDRLEYCFKLSLNFNSLS